MFFLVVLGAPAYAAPVGEVIFAIGQVHLKDAQEKVHKGFHIVAGQTLVTGPSGHVHIRFVDQGFVSVRPNSVMRVEQYVVDQQDPNKHRIKFELQEGTGRWITGRAGQMSKNWFRVNTPVGSIGVRGTDFVVQTSAAETRVAVYQGGVTVSAFDAQCKVEAYGPCSGSLAKNLAGSLSNQYLQIKPGVAAQLIQPKTGAAGKLFEPPSPQEPSVQKNSVIHDATAVETVAGLRSSDNLMSSGAMMWGRWRAAGAPAGYELAGSLDNFVLYRQLGQSELPKEGSVPLRLVASEAYARDSFGGLKPAKVSDASMTINFNSMAYATQFKWEYEGVTHSLSNKGSITSSGRLINAPTLSNFSLSGALGAHGDEAAYLFIKRLTGDDAFGVLHWRR